MNARCFTLACVVVLASLDLPARMTGRVLSADGRPVASAAVSAYAKETEEVKLARWSAGKPRPSLATASTDEEGAFSLEDGGLAVLDVGVVADGFAPAVETFEAGEPAVLELRKARSQTGAVLAAGKPLQGAIVVWQSSEASTPAEWITRSDETGRFVVPDPDVWGGAVHILHPQFAPLTTWRQVPGQSLSFTLKPGRKLQVEAVDRATGRGVPGAAVAADAWPIGKTNDQGLLSVEHADDDLSVVSASAAGLVGASPAAPGKVRIKLDPARTVSGAVRDAKSGGPIAGARIVVVDSATGFGASTLSDSRGRYGFASLPPGRLFVRAERKAYTAAGGPEESQLDLRKERSLQRDILMTRQKAIAGRVMDEGRRPVEGALVFLVPRQFPTIYTRALSALSGLTARSGADGGFSLKVDARVDGAGFPLDIVALKEGLAAGRTEVSPGVASFAITLPAGVQLDGTVTDRKGAPIPGVGIMIIEQRPLTGYDGPDDDLSTELEDEAWARTDATGHFTLRLNRAAHNFAFRSRGYATKAVRNRDPAAGGNLDVVLDDGAEVSGRVVRKGGAGVPGLFVSLEGAGGAGGWAATGDNGEFSFKDLAAGKYELTLARKGRAQLRERRLVDAPASNITIEIAPEGTLKGRVLDAVSGAPVSEFSVEIKDPSADEFDPAGTDRRDVANEEGVFELADVRIGSIGLLIRAPGHLARDLGVIPFSAETAPIEVRLEPGVSVQGRVTGKDGDPIPEVSVTATSRGGHDADYHSATTDENGDYLLDGLRAGPLVLTFEAGGYVSERRIIDTGETRRADAVLHHGLSLSGIVTSGGAPVAEVFVSASSSAAGARYQSAKTDDSGRFRIEGLVPGRYTLTARSRSSGKARLEDLDVERAGFLRIVLDKEKTAVLSGRVTGIAAGQYSMRSVSVEGEGQEEQESGSFDAEGRFRIENAPAGRVRVIAIASDQSGQSRTSKVRELTIPAGQETQTELEFSSDTAVRGLITRRGDPVFNAMVSFDRERSYTVSSTARTDEAGHYEILGLESGHYRVSVMSNGSTFETEMDLNGSARFDIDMAGAEAHGRAVDSGTGSGLADVEVSFWRAESLSSPEKSVKSDSRGFFTAASLREGRYRIIAQKEGFGQQVVETELSSAGSPEILLELSPSDGVRIKVFDARDGRPLSGIVVVRDMARRIVANNSSSETDGTLSIPIGPGDYLLSVSASGYGTVTIPLRVPSVEMRIALTPGGTLIVESGREVHGKLRLVQPDGEEYVRCWCNGIAEIRMEGRRTTISNITPGNYTLQVVDEFGAASQGRPVGIQEGQTTSVSIE